MQLKIVMLFGALALSASAFAADYQACTSIKLAKDRLACFDKFAVAQTAETESANAAAKQAEETKAQQDSAEAAEKAAVQVEVDKFKAVLTSRFKDPSSAQFKSVVAYGIAKPLRISFMCGQVNAKNSYGAYIGFKRFFMIGTASYDIEDSKNQYVIDQMWPTTCSGKEVYRQD